MWRPSNKYLYGRTSTFGTPLNEASARMRAQTSKRSRLEDDMNINGAFPSTYLKASDLQGRRVSVTMAGVRMEDIGGEQKPILSFVGKEKGLVLNKTNANMIAEITGSEETDDWNGQAIVLYPTKTDFQGKRVDAIRVDYPAPANGRPAKVKTARALAPEVGVNTDEFDDSIPF